MEKYRINSVYEEESCYWCGWPMIQGDHAWEHDNLVFCSRVCLEELLLLRRLYGALLLNASI